MNYRHIYHAGNFADVVKHIVLARVIEYLKRKPGAFRVIDTHAGAGIYDLSSEQAQKTGEWRDGIGRLHADRVFEQIVADLLAPYLEAVAAANPGPEVTVYPGSPMIARHLLRKQDRLTALELHPKDAATLKRRFAGDFQTRVIELDGWLALNAQLPPKEKRGLVIVDPPFEKEGEFDRLLDGLQTAYKRWPGGTYILWYPIKNRMAVDRWRKALRGSAIPKILDIRLSVNGGSVADAFDATGLIVVNPPFTLADELRTLLPALVDRLGRANGAGYSIDWLTGERIEPS